MTASLACKQLAAGSFGFVSDNDLFANESESQRATVDRLSPSDRNSDSGWTGRWYLDVLYRQCRILAYPVWLLEKNPKPIIQSGAVFPCSAHSGSDNCSVTPERTDPRDTELRRYQRQRLTRGHMRRAHICDGPSLSQSRLGG